MSSMIATRAWFLPSGPDACMEIQPSALGTVTGSIGAPLPARATAAGARSDAGGVSLVSRPEGELTFCTGGGSLRWMVDANPRFVLVHSPLLGPSAWDWVARELEQRGRSAVVPSLLGVADESCRPWHCEAVDAASTQRGETVVLVAHSAAGALLPAIAGSLSEGLAALVFADAFLPPARGTARMVPAEFVDQLRALATDAVLPPWSSWFGEEVMRDLVPDGGRRTRVEHDMPRLPLSSLQREVPVPDGWDRRPCAYLLLSAQPYAPVAADARARGWPVAEIKGGKHLDLVRRPAAVAAALLDLERAMPACP